VRIPQTTQVDSLNLSVAVGITLYAAAQRRI
jgi:tRNA G18 (ribose-2'-O)-methylase SpoU